MSNLLVRLVQHVDIHVDGHSADERADDGDDDPAIVWAGGGGLSGGSVVGAELGRGDVATLSSVLLLRLRFLQQFVVGHCSCQLKYIYIIYISIYIFFFKLN